jgi:hypothetical protein
MKAAARGLLFLFLLLLQTFLYTILLLAPTLPLLLVLPPLRHTAMGFYR